MAERCQKVYDIISTHHAEACFLRLEEFLKAEQVPPVRNDSVLCQTTFDPQIMEKIGN